jgi:hypothetical protein
MYLCVSTDSQKWRTLRKMSEGKIAALKEEIESIRFSDRLLWRRGKDSSHEPSVECQRRQDRLREVESELTLLQAETLRIR